MENKIKIVTLLEATLKLTRDIPEDFTLNYRKEPNGREVVYIMEGVNEVDAANVTMDSGTAMIKDIMKAKYFQ